MWETIYSTRLLGSQFIVFCVPCLSIGELSGLENRLLFYRRIVGSIPTHGVAVLPKWSKGHDWKSCSGLKHSFLGSNPRDGVRVCESNVKTRSSNLRDRGSIPFTPIRRIGKQLNMSRPRITGISASLKNWNVQSSSLWDGTQGSNLHNKLCVVKSGLTRVAVTHQLQVQILAHRLKK